MTTDDGQVKFWFAGTVCQVKFDTFPSLLAVMDRKLGNAENDKNYDETWGKFDHKHENESVQLKPKAEIIDQR